MYFTNMCFIQNVIWELAVTFSFPSERICHIHLVPLPQDSSNVLLIFTGLNNLESHLKVAPLCSWIWEIFAIEQWLETLHESKAFWENPGTHQIPLWCTSQVHACTRTCTHTHTHTLHTLWCTSQLAHWFQIRHAPPPAQLHGPCCCRCEVASVMSSSVRPHRQQPTRLPHPWDSSGKNTGVGCHFLLQCMKVKSESEVAQSCPTRSNPMDCSLPGSSVHGILQARVLEWGAIAFIDMVLGQILFLISRMPSVLLTCVTIVLYITYFLPIYLLFIDGFKFKIQNLSDIIWRDSSFFWTDPQVDSSMSYLC